MNISLENYLRDQLSQTEENHDYSVPTDTVRAWIDTYNESTQAILETQKTKVCADGLTPNFDCAKYSFWSGCFNCERFIDKI